MGALWEKGGVGSGDAFLNRMETSALTDIARAIRLAIDSILITLDSVENVEGVTESEGEGVAHLFRTAQSLRALLEQATRLAALNHLDLTSGPSTDLDPFVDQLVSMLRPHARDRGVWLSRTGSVGKLEVRVPRAVEEALRDLVTSEVRRCRRDGAVALSLASSSPGTVRLSIVTTSTQTVQNSARCVGTESESFDELGRAVAYWLIARIGGSVEFRPTGIGAASRVDVDLPSIEVSNRSQWIGIRKCLQ